tara:strand:- start:1427 stop:5116 length:3690 start_codon:yes stop_codon:yes gene_type:complete
MEFGLRKIVLIDSYVEGRASELDVSGHTNISGANGIGKTSFLKLIPIFYGESPRRLTVESANGNESFNSFYLKRNGSYLVFEYLSHGQPKMAVFCNRRNEARHRHVFIDSPYREDLFIDVANEEIYPAHTLLSRLNAEGIGHMSVDTTQQYRQILLDGTVSKAYHFSLCPRNGRMSKLTPLFTGMFKRSVQFADLSKVIQEYAMDKLDDDARQILENFSVHRDHLTATLTQYDAYQALEKARPESDQLSILLDDYTLTNTKLSAVVVASRDRQTALELQVRAYDEENQEIGQKISDEDKAHSKALEELDKQKKAHEEQRGPIATRIDNIQRSKTSYDEQELPKWEQKLAGIWELVGRHESYANQLKILADKSEEIRRPIEAEISTTRERAQQELDRLEGRYKELTGQQQSERKVISDRQSREIREQAKKQQQSASTLQASLSDLTSKISRLEERRDNPQASEELVRQFTIAESARDKAQEAFDTAQTDNLNASQRFETADNYYRAADQRFTDAREWCEKLEEAHANALSLVNGKESSLIYFLNENKPGWQNTLGRVLEPEILRNENLSPSLDRDYPDSQGLCGVSIDFSRLPEQELTPAALRSQMEEAAEDLGKAESEEAAAEKALARANNDRNDAKEHLSKKKAAFQRAHTELESAKDTLSTIRQKKAQSELNNKAETERELSKLFAEKGQLDKRMEALESSQDSEAEQLEARHEEEIEAFDTAYKDALAAIEASKTQTRDTRDADVKRLQEQLDQALAGHDIDPEEMERLSRSVKQLAEEIETIRAKEIHVKSYKRFMEEEYALLSGLKEDVSSLDKKLSFLRDERAEAVSNWNARRKELEGRIEKNNKAKTQANTDMTTLQVSILQTAEDRELHVSEHNESLALFREMDANSLTHEYQMLLQRESSKINELKKVGTRFATIFERFTGTPSTQYWQEAELDWDGTAAQVIIRARAILEYFRGGKHDLVRDTLASGFSNLDQIDIYRRAMEGFDKRIKRFNKELSSSIEQNLNFKAIERVEPTVTFELEELDYWKDIKSLADSVRTWRENTTLNSLPDEDLILSLRNYLDTFEESRANVTVKELWRLIRFRFFIIENGKPKTGSSSKDLSGDEGLSSNGLSYIVMIVLFLGFVNMLRKGQPVHLTWSLDELSAFDNDNKRTLLALLAEHHISLITACPDMGDRQLGMFNQVYRMERCDGGKRFVRWRMPEPGTTAANNPFKDISQGEV